MDLVGLHEIAELLSVSRGRADQLVRQTGFPDPVAVLKAGRVWEKAAVLTWARKEGRVSR